MERRNFIQSFAYCSIADGAASILPKITHAANQPVPTQETTMKRFGDGRDWFFEKRFGMFVHWGFRKNEDYYNDRHLIRSIDKYLSRGANYLLKVGPDPNGVIPGESSRILKNIGQWYKTVNESFGDAEPASQLTSNQSVMLTRSKNSLYVHLNKDPEGNVVKLRPFVNAPETAILLNTGQKVKFELEFAPQDHLVKESYLRLINLPTNEMCNTVLILKLVFDRSPGECVKANFSTNKINEKQK